MVGCSVWIVSRVKIWAIAPELHLFSEVISGQLCQYYKIGNCLCNSSNLFCFFFFFSASEVLNYYYFAKALDDFFSLK